MTNDEMTVEPAPWWKHGLLWMVIAGPATVAVAGAVTTWLAVSHPDPVLAPDYYRRGIEINKTLRAADKSQLPALQGRNHAVTPARP
jgi:hypothetical protein